MDGKLKKAFMSIRIPAQRWLDEAMFTEILTLLDANKGVVDDLALFTSFTHPPLPLGVIGEYAATMKQRIAAATAWGYRCGINVLATIGHHNENLPNSLQGDYTRRTDLDGRTCLGSFCPNDNRFVDEYVIPLYTAVAGADPDFIWIDDDVRSGHMPIGPDCFCDCCLEKFAELCGTLHTRQTIAEWLNGGTKTERMARRKLWLQGKRNTINRLFETIERTVHRINPAIQLGFMTGERYADGYDFETQANILAGPGGQEVLWRPGGGFYRDTTLKDMTEKSHQIGRQVSLLPQHVQSIQSEIENFNYESLGKSVYINATEVASHIAAGCTGAALNIMNIYEDITAEKSKLLKELRKQRPFFDELVHRQGRLPPQGIFTGWNKDSDGVRNLSGQWFGSGDGASPHYADQWFEIGLPMAYGQGGAQMAMFTGNGPYAFTEEQLLYWLSKGVYLDGPALEALNALGYGELTGFTVNGYLPVDCIEVLSDHALNGNQRGRMRDSRQSFWKCPCASLEPAAQGAETLAWAVDYGSRVQAACSMGVFENRLGGRVCVGGYYPWDFVLGYSKSDQCKQVVRWLTRDSLPAYVSSLHKVNLWVREDGEGCKVLTMLSCSMDAAQGLAVKVLTDSNTLRIADRYMNETIVSSCGSDGGYKEFMLPEMAPWSMLLAVTE